MKKILLTLFLVVTGVAIVTGWFGYSSYQNALQKPLQNIAANSIYELKPGTTVKQLATDLESRGIIDKALYLELYSRLNKLGPTIKAGEYELEPGLTIPALLALFSTGTSLQYKFTIIEGTGFSTILENLMQEEHLQKTLDTENQKSTFAAEFSKWANEDSPEGWLLPDTYYYTRNETDLDLLKRSWKAMQKYLNDAWENRADQLPLQTPYEALILASIVEKETGVASERPMIAGVFINRLNKGMKLQTDPTVIYGMGDKYTGNIRKKDLKTDTPWNTYTRKGLPPTPIAMPGREAIDAVMHPAKTSALFFVAKGGGAHHFSDSYKQHKQAVVKYLLNGNANRYQGDK